MEQVPRRKPCTRCGTRILPHSNIEISATFATTHPAWHEWKWLRCQLCSGKIWLGSCYGEGQEWPDAGIEWGGWGGGSFDNAHCEHCWYEMDDSKQTEDNEDLPRYPPE